MLSFTCAMPCRVFLAWLACWAALLEVYLSVSSGWSLCRVPQVLRLSSPGGRVVVSEAGMAVRALLLDLPCSSVGGLHCPGPVNARIIAWEIVFSLWERSGFPGLLGAPHRLTVRAVLVCPRL